MVVFQWQFVPILNPDGYAQTHKEGSGKGEGEVGLEDLFRMHRKNMRPKSAMNISEEIMARCDDEGEVAYLSCKRLICDVFTINTRELGRVHDCLSW